MDDLYKESSWKQRFKTKVWKCSCTRSIVTLGADLGRKTEQKNKSNHLTSEILRDTIKKQREGERRGEGARCSSEFDFGLKNFYNFRGREEKTEKAACDQKLSSSIPPGASLHHHLSHHASPDRTLQMHYGIWGRRARGRRASWIFDKTWDDQTEVVRRRGGSSILHHSATWILHGGNSLSLLIYFFSLFQGNFGKFDQTSNFHREKRVYPQPTSHCSSLWLDKKTTEEEVCVETWRKHW